MAEIAIQVSEQLNDLIRTFRRVDMSSRKCAPGARHSDPNRQTQTMTLTTASSTSVSDPEVGFQVVGQIDRVNLALVSPCGIIIESIFHQQYDMADKRDCD